MTEAQPSRSELIKRGLDTARAGGVKLGRPRSSRGPEIRELLLLGWSASRVRKHLSVGAGPVNRELDKIKAERGEA